MNKKLIFCGSKIVSKFGFQNGIQRYKCPNCERVFHRRILIYPNLLWQEYVEGKQTYAQLESKYNCSIKTIQRQIDSVKIEQQSTFTGQANVLMDTTYFGRNFGVMLFKNKQME